jgi:hypothetical protein
MMPPPEPQITTSPRGDPNHPISGSLPITPVHLSVICGYLRRFEGHGG